MSLLKAIEKAPLVWIGITTLFISCNQSPLPERMIWFDQPAGFFEQAFPLGNGRIGLSVYGDPINEKILLNEESLWAGGPVDAYMNPEGYTHLPEVRKALFEEDYKLADQLVRQLQGKFSESFAPLGDLILNFEHTGEISQYRRELDIRTGIASIQYEVDGNRIEREVFVSNPDQLAVIKVKSRKKAGLTFEVGLRSQLQFSTSSTGKQLIMDGKAPIHAEPNYRGNIPNAIVYGDKGQGMRFSVLVEIETTDGEVIYNDNGIAVNGVSEAILKLSIATSYNGFDKDPGLNGQDEKKLAAQWIDQVRDKGYNAIRNDHQKDFSDLINRVSLSLDNSQAPESPIDKRLAAYTDGAIDLDLEALYFQFGRYLLVSSSRQGGIPANLQGIWNPHLRPPWSSNYTANINSEMNYWLAENTNLSELHEPLLSFIERLSTTGTITAKTFYDCKGWCCSHNTDIWAMTNPVGDFGGGHPVWANWSMAGAWYSLHLYDHFTFTRDTTWLLEYAYPLMRGAARFCLDFLVDGPAGYLVTAPSTSPENLYKTDDGYVGATLYGSTSDLAFIRGLLEKIIAISQFLETDESLRDECVRTLEQLYPYQVGSKGNLQEWYHDWEDQNPFHRHLSHLVGLYPDNQISPIYTPALAEACTKSMVLRGDGGTGWSKAWKINLWARLLDGNHAYTMLRSHLNYVDPSGETKYSGGGTYPNLWDAHPPFQIDGNFGGTAGVAEMLLQSQNGEIHLLPALPDAWQSGQINGLRARGALTVDQAWIDGKLTEARFEADYDGDYQIRYGERIINVHLKSGRSKKITAKDFQ